MQTAEVKHVVADDSIDPEHVDDCPGCAATVQDEGFYVTVRDRAKSAFLLGPYTTHDEALANVDRARRYAMDAYPFETSFAGFGTAKVTAKPGRELRPGKFNLLIGLTAE